MRLLAVVVNRPHKLSGLFISSERANDATHARDIGPDLYAVYASLLNRLRAMGAWIVFTKIISVLSRPIDGIRNALPKPRLS